MVSDVETLKEAIHKRVLEYWETFGLPFKYRLLSGQYTKRCRTFGHDLEDVLRMDDRLVIKMNSNGARLVFPVEGLPKDQKDRSELLMSLDAY